MTYRHIDTIAKEEWFSRPWIMLGTGPSLDEFRPEEWEDYNIAAIYDAFYACKRIDVLFASDDWTQRAFEAYHYWNDPKNRYVATRSINARNITDQTNVVLWDYTCDENNWGIRLFSDRQPYPCSNTSSFIVLWLGTMGVREIRTWGIDGGWGLSKHVSEPYRVNSTPELGWNPDVENEGVYGHASSFGIKIIKM